MSVCGDKDGLGHLTVIIGLPASGKTTLTRRLQAQGGGVRLNADEWMSALAIDLFDEPFRAALERKMTELAGEMLRHGLRVVDDFESWTRSEHDKLLGIARAAAATTKLVCLDLPVETLWRRLATRNTEPSQTAITRELLQSYTAYWEPASSEELETWNG